MKSAAILSAVALLVFLAAAAEAGIVAADLAWSGRAIGAGRGERDRALWRLPWPSALGFPVLWLRSATLGAIWLRAIGLRAVFLPLRLLCIRLRARRRGVPGVLRLAAGLGDI